MKKHANFDFYLRPRQEAALHGTDLARIRMYSGMLIYDFAQLLGVKWIKLRDLEESSEELTPDKYGELARSILERIKLPPEAQAQYHARLSRLADLPTQNDPELRLARKKLGMTQEQLAKRFNCTQAFLSLCERGKRTISPKHQKVLEHLLQDR